MERCLYTTFDRYFDRTSGMEYARKWYCKADTPIIKDLNKALRTMHSSSSRGMIQALVDELRSRKQAA
jgi:hypothetical protein